MSDRESSYFKTVLAAGVVAVGSGALFAIVVAFVHGVAGLLLATVAGLAAAEGGVVAACGLLAIHRTRRDAAGSLDLFLSLNRRRAADALEAGSPRSWIRRSLGRVALGHEFLVGDPVEVRPLHEIQATLDARGELDGMPFMPEMVRMCGARGRVYRCADKIYDYGRTKRMRRLEDCVVLIGMRCDGAAHGGCEAGCLYIWKTRWLRRLSAEQQAAATARHSGGASLPATTALSNASPVDRFVCQFTQLQNATRPFAPIDVRKGLRPLIAGNVTLMAFGVALATRWFNVVQTWRGGVGYPLVQPGQKTDTANPPPATLVAGDTVTVRPLAEIESTLNRSGKNRGLWFDGDMVRHCGRCYRVRNRVNRIIDVTTGRMLEMKTPCIVLDGVECSGEFQEIGAQHELLYWRESWLRKHP